MIYNEILQSKSINNLKSLNFKEVNATIEDGKNPYSKIIDLTVKKNQPRKRQFGTSGGTFQFGVKENNYLGKGIAVNAFASISSETFKTLEQI